MPSLPQKEREISMNDSTQNRKTIFIQKQYQLKSIMTVVGLIVVSGLVSGILLFFLLSSELASELKAAHTNLQNASDNLVPIIIFSNIVTIIVTGTVAGLAVLYQSHKIAGPLYRIKSICDDVTSGNYETMTSLRKHDQLTNLASSFEKMLKSLRGKKDKRNESISQVQQNLEQIKNLSNDEQINKQLEQASVSLAQLNEN